MFDNIMQWPLETKITVVTVISYFVTFALKRWVSPSYWQTEDGDRLLRQVPILVGTAVFGTWGNDEHALIAGAGSGALARAVPEVASAMTKLKARKRRRTPLKEKA